MSLSFHHAGGGTGVEPAAFAGDFIRINIDAVVIVSKPAFCNACFLVIICLLSKFISEEALTFLMFFIFDDLFFLFVHRYFLSKSSSLIFDIQQINSCINFRS